MDPHPQIPLQTLVNALYFTTNLDVRYVDTDLHTRAQRRSGEAPEKLSLTKEALLPLFERLRKGPQQCLHLVSELRLEALIAANLEEGQLRGIVILGPFLSEVPDLAFVGDVVYRQGISVAERNKLRRYYQSLQVMNHKKINAHAYLLTNLLGSSLRPPVLVKEGHAQSPKEQRAVKPTLEESMEIIESRYNQETAFLEAISKGDLARCKELNKASSIFFSLPDRVPHDPTRSFKNLLFVLNTLSRKAAQWGDVHPFYIHDLSEKYAIAIEKASSQWALQKLADEIPLAYTELVKTYSTKKYSLVVKKAVDFITFHFDEDLTLPLIAEAVPVNPSHLSRKFKEETGLTVSTFINYQRIKEAKIHLSGDQMSITDVAFLVGFNNLNYFTRTFKSITGVTPTVFRNQRRQKK